METAVEKKGEKKSENKPAQNGARPFGRNGNGREGGFKKNVRRAREPRVRSEFDQKIISIRRVTRVSAGGRRFSFSVAIVIGNKKGQVGVGLGKGSDTALAIEKAAKNAKRNLIKIKTTKGMSIPHEVDAKFSSSQVMLIPTKGKGLVCGSAVRVVIELAGLKDITGKILTRSKNKLNIAKATVKALSQVSE